MNEVININKDHNRSKSQKSEWKQIDLLNDKNIKWDLLQAQYTFLIYMYTHVYTNYRIFTEFSLKHKSVNICDQEILTKCYMLQNTKD